MWKIGVRFDSETALREYILEYEKSYKEKLYIRNSGSVHMVKTKYIKPELKYSYVLLACIHGGMKFKSKSTGRRQSKTLKMDCPFRVRLKSSQDGHFLEVVAFQDHEGHKLHDQKEVHKRNENFTREEATLLFTIVKDFNHIVDSNHIDAADAAWETITSTYNASIGDGGAQRDSELLKWCWNTRHRKIKQMFAKDQAESLPQGESVLSTKKLQKELDVKNDGKMHEQLEIDNDAEWLPDSSAWKSSFSSDSADSSDSEANEESTPHLDCKMSSRQEMSMSSDHAYCTTHSKPRKGIKDLMEIKIESAELKKKLLEQELNTKRIEHGLNLQIMQQKLMNMKLENELASLQLSQLNNK